MKKSMADVAAQAAVNAPQTFRRKEIEGELNFISDLDALDAALEADNIVCRFNNPDPEGEPIDFELRPMTPGEFSVYYQTLLGHTLLEAAAGMPNSDPELDDEQAQKLQDELSVKKYDEKLLGIIESCMLSPPGITAERMRKWDPFYIMGLHNSLMNGSRPSKAVARFSTVDEGS